MYMYILWLQVLQTSAIILISDPDHDLQWEPDPDNLWIQNLDLVLDSSSYDFNSSDTDPVPNMLDI